MPKSEAWEQQNENSTNFQNEISGGQVNQAGGDINVTSNLNQKSSGDRNQTIGQIYGGMVVYVSGGQAIVNPPQIGISDADAHSVEIEPNLYKGWTVRSFC